MRESIHPTRETLIAFIEGRLEKAVSEKIQSHLNKCEFCKEFCEDTRLIEETGKMADDNLPISSKALADHLYHESLKGLVVSLIPLCKDGREYELPLAADNKHEPDPSDQHAITLFSEDPEIILRLMMGPQPQDNYVQLIADDTTLVSHVLIQAPQLGKEFITDANGRADIGAEPVKLTDDIKWQIKMPDAVFDLAPLKYDPDKPEQSDQVTLETDRHDKLQVTFERLTEGRKITLQLLELDGKQDFGEVKVVIATEQSSRQEQISSDSSATFEIDDNEATVNIRLFTK